MSLYVRVFTNFYTHRKTMRLRATLGDDAYWIPPRLWAYAAENQPDGDFSGYSDRELAMLLGYSKDASSMLQALVKSGFLDEDRKIHDWSDYNEYHRVFAQRAKTAALAKWEKIRNSKKEEEKIGKDKKGQEASIQQACSKDASSIDESNPMNPSPTPESMERFERLRVALHAAFHKKPNQTWDYAELSMLCELNRREGVEEELKELLTFKETPNSFFPFSVTRLLSAWSETLDRSRNQKPNANNRYPGQQSVSASRGTANEGTAAGYANARAIRKPLAGANQPVQNAGRPGIGSNGASNNGVCGVNPVPPS